MIQFDALRGITRRELRINYRSPLICQLAPVASGSSSGMSEGAFLPIIAPDGPTGLSAVVSLYCPRVVTLSWIAVPDSIGYNVYRATSVEGPFEYLTSPTVTTYDDAVVDGVVYYYQVNAFGEFGSSNPSQTLAVDVPACP